MTQTDPIAEARRLFEELGEDQDEVITDDWWERRCAWLASNPESKPAGGVTEAKPHAEDQVARVRALCKTLPTLNSVTTLHRILSSLDGPIGNPSEAALGLPACVEAQDALNRLRALCDAEPYMNSVITVHRILETVGALASAAPAAPETIPAEWQAIETAPKDGSTVLVAEYIPHGRNEWCVLAAHYIAKRRRWYEVGDFGDEDFSQPWKPTHWMPLPLPPAAPAVSQPPADTRETGNG